MQKYFLKNSSNDHISAWKSKGFSSESIKIHSTSKNILNYIYS